MIADHAPLVTDDGLIYDVDPGTGEVLSVQAALPGFVVDSAERADWVLAKMLHADSEIAAINGSATVAQAKAILANAEAMTRRLANHRAALEWRFGPELAKFAKANLGNTRTWRGLYGSVSFRATAARLKVTDQDSAGRWALAECPEAVKIDCMVSLIPPSLRSSVLAGDVPAPPGMEVVAEGETVVYKTGVAP